VPDDLVVHFSLCVQVPVLGVVVVRFSEPVLVQGFVVVVHFYQSFPEPVPDVPEGLFFDSDLDSVPVQHVQAFAL